MIQIYLTETIDGYEPIPDNLPINSLEGILLNKLKPYEDTLLTVYDQLSKKSQDTYLKYFNAYKQAFMDIGKKLDDKFAGGTWDPSNIFTKLENKASPNQPKSWSHRIMGSGYSDDFGINPYIIQMKDLGYNVSDIVFTDGTAVLGIPTDDPSWLDTVKYYSNVKFLSEIDAKKFAEHFHLKNYTIKPLRKVRTWSNDKLTKDLTLLRNPTTFAGGVPVLYDWWKGDVHSDGTEFIDFTKYYNTTENKKANIKDIILNPISKKYNLQINRWDAGDEFGNTTYAFYDPSINDDIFYLTYYSKGPANHPAKYLIDLQMNTEQHNDNLEFYLGNYQGDKVKMMDTVKQTIETHLNNYYNSNKK